MLRELKSRKNDFVKRATTVLSASIVVVITTLALILCHSQSIYHLAWSVCHKPRIVIVRVAALALEPVRPIVGGPV